MICNLTEKDLASSGSSPAPLELFLGPPPLLPPEPGPSPGPVPGPIPGPSPDPMPGPLPGPSLRGPTGPVGNPNGRFFNWSGIGIGCARIVGVTGKIGF